MTPRFFDVHTHVNFAAFRGDYKEVIQHALDAGIWMVNVGTQQDTSKRAVEIAHEFAEGVYASVGLHPIHTEKSHHDEQELGISNKQQATSDKGFTSRGEKFDYEYYKTLAQDEKVVAIGECGLDYFRLGEETKQKQREAFEAQIALAHDVKKPLMIHCRNAFSDLISILQTPNSELPTTPGVIHFFSGAPSDAKNLLGLGFSFSFGGVITFVRDYDEVVRYIPLDRILLETDAPYVTPVPYRGKRNEPVYVVEVAKKIAEIKKISAEKAQAITAHNSQNLLRV